MDRHYDENWWVKRKLRSEGVSFLPPSLALRKEVEDVFALIEDESSEDVVRSMLRDINDRIRHVNRTAFGGPPSSVAPFDVERAIVRWRQERS